MYGLRSVAEATWAVVKRLVQVGVAVGAEDLALKVIDVTGETALVVGIAKVDDLSEEVGAKVNVNLIEARLGASEELGHIVAPEVTDLPVLKVEKRERIHELLISDPLVGSKTLGRRRNAQPVDRVGDLEAVDQQVNVKTRDQKKGQGPQKWMKPVLTTVWGMKISPQKAMRTLGQRQTLKMIDGYMKLRDINSNELEK